MQFIKLLNKTTVIDDTDIAIEDTIGDITMSHL